MKKKIKIIGMILALSGVAAIGFIYYVKSIKVNGDKIKITILKGVRQPGTKIFDKGTTLREIFFAFKPSADVNLANYNLNEKIIEDKEFKFKLESEKENLSKISLDKSKKLKIPKELISNIKKFLTKNKGKKVSWLEIQENLKIESTYLSKLQANFTLD
ncbi:hypothetical protein [Mesomycoplasma bovoculi]|uniref:Uncharacterized protein n=1 Tax=Mesomycoplasma bovoculi M165/69 TaxID=743966 RepID=W5UTA2_9BACT|nr:hypothetical protein [Mesomycoplasma bovoculi]AHH45040.1 hypothetical protein MYB_00140 [Mesomycoplasma bovoculi M165/69]